MFTNSCSHFEISGTFSDNNLNFLMKVPQDGHVTTATLPTTGQILGRNLPSIFTCKCFNDANKEFSQECQNTELGHLFEHIMLEYLCMEKIQEGSKDAVYEGVTKWNWEEDPIGTFYINIKIDERELDIIEKAFKRAIWLLNKILVN